MENYTEKVSGNEYKVKEGCELPIVMSRFVPDIIGYSMYGVYGTLNEGAKFMCEDELCKIISSESEMTVSEEKHVGWCYGRKCGDLSSKYYLHMPKN